MVGKLEWNKHCATDSVSDIATVSDEAFAHLAIANSWMVWECEATEKDLKDDEGAENPLGIIALLPNHPNATSKEALKPKYTMNCAQARRHEGWLKEAVADYNKLMKK